MPFRTSGFPVTSSQVLLSPLYWRSSFQPSPPRLARHPDRGIAVLEHPVLAVAHALGRSPKRFRPRTGRRSSWSCRDRRRALSRIRRGISPPVSWGKRQIRTASVAGRKDGERNSGQLHCRRGMGGEDRIPDEIEVRRRSADVLLLAKKAHDPPHLHPLPAARLNSPGSNFAAGNQKDAGARPAKDPVAATISLNSPSTMTCARWYDSGIELSAIRDRSPGWPVVPRCSGARPGPDWSRGDDRHLRRDGPGQESTAMRKAHRRICRGC